MSRSASLSPSSAAAVAVAVAVAVAAATAAGGALFATGALALVSTEALDVSSMAVPAAATTGAAATTTEAATAGAAAGAATALLSPPAAAAAATPGLVGPSSIASCSSAVSIKSSFPLFPALASKARTASCSFAVI